MKPTREEASIAVLMERYETLSASPPPSQEEVEDLLHTEVWRGEWEEVLRLLDVMPGPISRGAANECLIRGVQKASPEVFCGLLDRLPQEEYAETETYFAKWSPTGEKLRRHRWEISVQGTLVMHAVAGNRPECLRVLLERGHDVNSASPTAAAALIKSRDTEIVSYGEDYIPFYPYTVRPESRICLRRWDADPEDLAPMELEGATPLALAVLMGHEACARILLEHGAWREEAPGVSQVLWMAWRQRDEAYQATRALVLEWGEPGRPVLWALCRTCTPGQLKTVLETYVYSREELSFAARSMLVAFSHQRELWRDYADGWRDLCHRLYLLGRVSPEALCAPEVCGFFFECAACWREKDWERLLPLLKGQTMDLSQLSRGFMELTRPEGRELLEQLGEYVTLVMDRDAVPEETPIKVLRFLLRHVTFLPGTAEQGVSGLTQAILRTGDLRMICRALRTGLIPPTETTEDLLNVQRKQKLPPVCRSALLTTARPILEEPAVRLRSSLRNRWFTKKLPRDVAPILTEEEWEPWLYPTLRTPFGDCQAEALGEQWQLHKVFFAACLQGREDLVERWLAWEDPRQMRNTDSMICFERDFHVVLTPLCAAALGGHTSIARRLIERGVSAAEHLWGSPCIFGLDWMGKETYTRVPFHPLMAALLGQHWDTAELLLRHGAVCDLAEQGVQTLWKKFHDKDLEETVRRHLGAYVSGSVLKGGKTDEQ